MTATATAPATEPDPTAPPPVRAPALTWDEAYTKYGKDARYFARWLAQKRPAVRDEADEAGLFGLFTAWRLCTDWSTFLPYMRCIVRFEVLRRQTFYRNLGHRRNAHEVYSLGDMGEENWKEPAARPEPDEPPDLPPLAHLLAGLTPKQREAVEAVYLRGELYREAADRCGVTRQMVHVRVRDALARMREQLEGRGVYGVG